MGLALDTDTTLAPDQANAQLFDCIDALTRALTDETDAQAAIPARLQSFAEQLAALADAASAADLPGLIDTSALLADRIATLDDDSDVHHAVCALLEQFPLVLMDYVLSPADPAAAAAILDLVRHPTWPTALGEEEIELLRILLLPPDQAPETEEFDHPETGGRFASDAAPTAGTPEPASAIDLGCKQSVTEELLHLAREAFETNYSGLFEALALSADPAHGAQGWEQFLDELDRLAAGAEAVGLGILAQTLLGLRTSLLLAHPGGETLPASAVDGLMELPDRLRDYLSDPTGHTTAEAFVALIVRLAPQWLPEDQTTELAHALQRVELAASEIAEADQRPTIATESDVSLALPDDLNQELLEGLLTELPLQTSTFTEAVQHIASGHGRLVDIDDAKRAAHTLKGAANTVGIRGIANLTHHLEDILIALADHGSLPNLGLSQTLGYAADCLETMSEALGSGGAAPEDAVQVLQDVLNWANRITHDGIEVAAADTLPVADSAGADDHAERAHAPLDPRAVAVLRVPTTLVDEQLRLVGESMTSTAQIQNRLALALQQISAVNLQNQLLRQLVNELEDLVDLRGIALPQPSHPDTGFDALEFDQYGELHTVTRRLVEVTTDAGEMTRNAHEQLTTLGDLIGHQARLHLSSQDTVLRARMVPVSSVASRLQRAVRQAGRLLDKEVVLDLQGVATLIDGNVLNELVDALMHLLRNAVDHGIEGVDQRLAAGKDPVGHIELSFKREGDVIRVSCRDDGQGLDLDHVRRVAQRRKLIGANDALADDQLARLIFAPGFSTRDETTQVSGRGIGLDAVNTIVEELKGSLALVNSPGQGLAIEIRLPTTLLSAQALLIRVQGTLHAVATRGIEEIRFIAPDELLYLGRQRVYRQRDQVHDVVRLADLLGLDKGEPDAANEQTLLMVRLSSGLDKAVLVESIAESRSLVVKKLGRYVAHIDGVIGATILGDGSVAPVVDLPDLLRAAERPQWSGPERRSALEAADRRAVGHPSRGDQRTALVVDDSISARRTTAQLFRDAGFEVQTAIDGLDAVAILDRMVPDLILTDLEMPRMNGLELTAHVRARDATKEVPIVMITSRSTEKHRQQAESKGVDLYLTKPFSPDDLLRQAGALAGR